MTEFNNIENKQITDTSGNKHWISPSVSVDALLLVAGFVLIVKRSTNMANANKWCLPCGYLDFNETFLDACIRELHEETGVDVREFNLFNYETYKRPYALNGTGIQFIFELYERPVITVDNHECIDYAWVSTSMLKDYDFAFSHDNLIEYILNQ